MSLDTIEAELPTVEWVAREAPRDAICYTGRTESGWSLLVVSFGIEDQGFPSGSRGYDGTAWRDGAVVHLSRELAEKAAFHAARAALFKSTKAGL